jgi:hypothetical protein
MKASITLPQMTRAEQEAQTEANRLIEQIQNALAELAIRSSDVDSLLGAADRIDRAARDLAYALRELAGERRAA